jgi:hypothetical protein
VKDLETLQARILEADRAQRDIDFDRQELAEALQNAAARALDSNAEQVGEGGRGGLLRRHLRNAT